MCIMMIITILFLFKQIFLKEQKWCSITNQPSNNQFMLGSIKKLVFSYRDSILQRKEKIYYIIRKIENSYFYITRFVSKRRSIQFPSFNVHLEEEANWKTPFFFRSNPSSHVINFYMAYFPLLFSPPLQFFKAKLHVKPTFSPPVLQ